MKYTEKMYNNLPYPLQNIALSLYGKKIKSERFCDDFYKWMEFLDKSQFFQINELINYQNEKLKKIISYAYSNIPYYQKIFQERKLDSSDIKSVEDLVKLPILKKDDIRKNFDLLISKQYNLAKLKIGHTSGTTGTPLKVVWDQNIDILHNVAIWRHRKWAQFSFGSRYATLLGRVIVPLSISKPPFYRINKPWNQFVFSSFHLNEENLKSYFDDFNRLNIRYMEAYPSTAYVLAKYLEENNKHYKMNSIVTSSETLLPIQREIIENRFQCKVFDYYGMAERAMFSGECEQHMGHHLHMEYGITEILDENDLPVKDGDPGKLVLTSLHNFGMPLIRYEIGDVSSIKKNICKCGRTLPLLEAVTTKAEDIVVTKDGRLISSSVLTHPFKPMTNIAKSQIIQEDYDSLKIRLVKKEGYSENDTKVLIEGLQNRVGKDMKIIIEFVENIERTKNGKYRWVISKVPLIFGSKKISNLYNEE